MFIMILETIFIGLFILTFLGALEEILGNVKNGLESKTYILVAPALCLMAFWIAYNL